MRRILSPLIHHTALIHPNVTLGDNVRVGPFCVLGDEGGLPLTIGAGSVIRSHTVIEGDNRIGERFETGHHTTIRAGNHLHSGVMVGSYAILEGGAMIGEGARIRSRCSLNNASVGIGAQLFDGVVLVDGNRPPDGERDGPVIFSGVVLSAGVMVMAGVSVGHDSYVAARAVVERDVPARTFLARSGRTCPVEAMR